MGLETVYVSLILPALALSVDPPSSKGDGHFDFYSEAVVGDVWPGYITGEDGGRSFSKSLQQLPNLNQLYSSLLMPLQTWDFMDVGAGFALRVTDSSWSGPVSTDVYEKGELMFLQITASTLPGQELYVHSCYAGPSPDPSDKSRYALILNKGCVASKQSVVKFVSRGSDVINLVFNTKELKFSQVYIHCSVVLSYNGLTPDSKACNYDESEFRWVELGGQTGVCDCCATKCKGFPYYRALSSEFKALVSAGPLVVKEQPLKELLSANYTTITASQIGASAVFTGNGLFRSAAPPYSTGNGRIVAGDSVSGKSMHNSSPWWPQPADSMMVLNQDQSSFSLLLPGLVLDVLDVQSSPAVEIGFSLPPPPRKGIAKIVGVPIQSSTPTKQLPDATPDKMWKENPFKELPDLEPENHEIVGNGYASDDPAVVADGNVSKETSLENVPKMDEEELRGDVFMNFKNPQVDSFAIESSFSDALPFHVGNSVSPALALPENDLPEERQEKEEVAVLTQTEMLFKRVKGDVLGEPDFLTRSKLTITQASDGSSSLSYEEEQRTQKVEKDVRATKLKLKTRKAGEGKAEGSLKNGDIEREVVQSLMDLLRGLSKTQGGALD